MTETEAQPTNPAAALRRAANLISQRNLHRGDYRGPNGSLCALGGLWEAVTGDRVGTPIHYLRVDTFHRTDTERAQFVLYRRSWTVLESWLQQNGYAGTTNVTVWSDNAADKQVVVAGLKAAADQWEQDNDL